MKIHSCGVELRSLSVARDAPTHFLEGAKDRERRVLYTKANRERGCGCQNLEAHRPLGEVVNVYFDPVVYEN